MHSSPSDRAFLATLRGDNEPLEGENSAIGRKMRSSSKGPLKALSIPGFSFRAPSLIDKSKPYFSGIRRFGVSKVGSFYKDPFHTLLNLPWGSFIFVFFSTYILQYIAFAFLYWMQGSCVKVEAMEGADSAAHDNTFARSLWMSSRVASTLGFTEIRPDPECPFVNFCVMIQVIASSLVNFIMLGVVFARFSAPFKRASTVRFSKVATVSRHPSGFWSLSLRVANLRKHQILQPTVRLVVTAVDSITPSFYHHEQLQIEGAYKQLTNLELGFPATISHVITPDSFLYNLSLLEMDTRMMEILVFVDGIDAMTSKYMSARIAYSTSDIYMNEQFAPMNLEMRGKYLGLDFSDFDKTVPALDPALLVDMNEEKAGAPAGGGGGLWQLRHQTFKRLAERYAHLGVSHTAVVAAAAAAGTKVGAADTLELAHGSGGGGAAVTTASSSDMQNSLLAGHVLPSHLPAAASMTSSTSGMPFAVARPGQQVDKAGLSSLFGVNKAPGGGAWTSIHSKDHTINGEGPHEAAEPFVPVPSMQRGPGNAGSAWAQSGIPLSPMPVLGAPPVGLAGNHNSTSPSYGAGSAGAGGQFSSPLLQQDMYSLDEENPPPALPASKNAGGK